MTHLKSDYEEIKVIGRGSFGTCSMIKRKYDGKIFVWKQMKFPSVDNSAELKRIKNELDILSKIQHKFIVKYHGHIMEKDRHGDNIVYIIMDYCVGGDLCRMIKKTKQNECRFTEVFIWGIFLQLVQALKHCHSANVNGEIILHRDLKPENVFLTQELDAKLGDFGCSRIMDMCSLANTRVGTIVYMAPELNQGHYYDEKCDIWSLGCLIHEMCTLEMLFRTMNRGQLRKMTDTKSIPEIPKYYSKHLQKMVKSMLRFEPDERPSAEDLYRQIARMGWHQSLKMSKENNVKHQVSKEKTVKQQRQVEENESRAGYYYYGMETMDFEDSADDDNFLCPLHGMDWESGENGSCSLCSYIYATPAMRKSALQYKEKIHYNSSSLLDRLKHLKEAAAKNPAAAHDVPYLAILLSTDKIQSLMDYIAPEKKSPEDYVTLCPKHGRGWDMIQNQQCSWCERNRHLVSQLVYGMA